MVVEKPFGRDSASSKALSTGLARYLAEEQARPVPPLPLSTSVACVPVRLLELGNAGAGVNVPHTDLPH